MKKYLLGLLGLITAIIGFFFAKRKVSDLSFEDKMLESRQSEKQKSIDEQKEALEKLRKEHDQATKDTSQMSPEQIQEYWRKRNDS